MALPAKRAVVVKQKDMSREMCRHTGELLLDTEPSHVLACQEGPWDQREGHPKDHPYQVGHGARIPMCTPGRRLRIAKVSLAHSAVVYVSQKCHLHTRPSSTYRKSVTCTYNAKVSCLWGGIHMHPAWYTYTCVACLYPRPQCVSEKCLLVEIWLYSTPHALCVRRYKRCTKLITVHYAQKMSIVSVYALFICIFGRCMKWITGYYAQENVCSTFGFHSR